MAAVDEPSGRIAALSPQKQAELLRRLRQRPSAAPEKWIVPFQPDPEAGQRLFCFSYAGGGASVFRSWGASLAGVEVFGVQLPGRETRIAEPAYRRIGPLIDTLAEAIAPYLDRPFVFFGHSMGSLVAFELARHLRRTSQQQPIRLLLAAYRAPQLPNPNIKIYHLPDEVMKVVLRTDGTPSSVLDNDELMAAMLPTLRADFELCDTYEYESQAPFDYPISIFGGQEDVRVSASDLEQWRAQTDAGSTFTRLPGSHFFLHASQDLLLEAIGRELASDVHAEREGSHV